MAWDNVEDAFKELDENEFTFFSRSLAAYRRRLMSEGFTRREAMRLVEAYSKFIYDISIEEFMAEKDSERADRIFGTDDVDDDDEEDV